MPPATSSPAAKKLAKLAVPTRTSTRHKDLLSSKGAKPSPAVKPKAALASLKGKAPAVPLAGPPVGAGPSVPPVNAATVCSGVMGMTVAGAKEDVTDTVTRLDHNQLRLGAAVIDLKDALGATDSNAAIRDDALVSQMGDVRKYISEVRAAQLSVPDAPSSEDFHALEESITTLMKSTEGRFTSFQSVLNAITERITLPAPAIASAPVQTLPVPPVPPGLPPAVLDDRRVPVLAPTVPVGNPVPVHAPFSQIGASTPARNIAVDPSHVFPPYPSAQPQSTYPSAPFSQYPPASGPIRGQQDNRIVRVMNIAPGSWNPRTYGRVLVEEGAGINFRDITDVKRISSTALTLTFRLSNDALRFMSACTHPDRSVQLQRIRVDFVDPSRPNDRPTLDDVCGPSPPSLGSGSVPAGYENYARP